MYGGFLPCTSSTSEEDEGFRVGDVLPTAAASLLCTLASLHPLQLPLRISRLQLLQSQWSLFFHLYCSQLCSVLCQVLNPEGAAAALSCVGLQSVATFVARVHSCAPAMSAARSCS